MHGNKTVLSEHAYEMCINNKNSSRDLLTFIPNQWEPDDCYMLYLHAVCSRVVDDEWVL